jgi:hypothetical protein
LVMHHPCPTPVTGVGCDGPCFQKQRRAAPATAATSSRRESLSSLPST